MIAKRGAIAFTLIELLVVVGILLVLASLAAGQYTEASIRAKVARARADMRTLHTAIDMYHADSNKFPRMAHAKYYGDPTHDLVLGAPVVGVVSKVLSTPIAYIGSPFIIDPFMVGNEGAPLDERLYTYHVTREYLAREGMSTFWPAALEYYGEWRLGSVGPDLSFEHFFLNSAQLPYDPTNGTISLGNIWYSHKSREGLPPIPSVVGYH